MKRLLLFIFIAGSLTTISSAQSSRTLQGDWQGAITLPQQSVPIQTHFQHTDSLLSGTLDIQGTSLPLQNIRTTDGDSVFFQFATSINIATFKGMFQSQGKITGQYIQAGQQFSFQLTQNTEPEDSSQTTSTGPGQELVIQNGSVKIGGTLSQPKHPSSQQLVIMISGSGPQDRDETMTPVSNFKPFALLTDSLTNSGIATFRYDDRGVDSSTGTFKDATLDTLASDVEAIINYFNNKSDYHFDDIILLGHSQGGIVGGKVAAQNNQVNKLILMASPAVSLKTILRYQVKNQFQQAGIDSILVNREVEAREKLMQAIHDGKGIQEAKQIYKQRFAAIQRSARTDSSYASTLASQQTTQLAATFRSPQMLSLLFHDPTADLSSLNIPVLVLFGSKDTQVTVEINKSPIEHTLETADIPYQIEVFEQANHLFQKAQTGQASEYGSLPDKFVKGFTSTISQWIQHQQ